MAKLIGKGNASGIYFLKILRRPRNRSNQYIILNYSLLAFKLI
jgi:hypothetical protein